MLSVGVLIPVVTTLLFYREYGSICCYNSCGVTDVSCVIPCHHAETHCYVTISLLNVGLQCGKTILRNV